MMCDIDWAGVYQTAMLIGQAASGSMPCADDTTYQMTI